MGKQEESRKNRKTWEIRKKRRKTRGNRGKRRKTRETRDNVGKTGKCIETLGNFYMYWRHIMQSYMRYWPVSIWTALKPVCLATAPVIRTSLLTIFTAWALKNQSNFDRVINSHHFQLQGEFLGNLQCCNSFTGKKIVSYIKAEDGPVFTVYSEVRYVAKHCNRLKLTRYSYTARVIFPYSNIQIIFYAFKLTCKLKSYVSIPFTSTICVK